MPIIFSNKPDIEYAFQGDSRKPLDMFSFNQSERGQTRYANGRAELDRALALCVEMLQIPPRDSRR